MVDITVATATYNRANCLPRLFDSLMKQTYKNFEWIIVDDGSTDNTKEIVESLSSHSKFPIVYIYQENQGKHIAINKAAKNASGSYFSVIDSDDICTPNALKRMRDEWNRIKNKEMIKSVTCRTFDPITGKVEGRFRFKREYYELRSIDANYKKKMKYEKWSLDRIEVIREFPFPELNGYDGKPLHFIPETILFDKIAKKYKEHYIPDALRGYYHDQNNALTSRNNRRSQSNYYLWIHNINDVLGYFIYSPFVFMKSGVGVFMDGLMTGRKVRKIYQDINGVGRKIFISLFFPAGFIMYLKRRRK